MTIKKEANKKEVKKKTVKKEDPIILDKKEDPNISYAKKRMKQIGYDRDKEKIYFDSNPDESNGMVECDLFWEDKHGNLCINYFDLNDVAYTHDLKQEQVEKASKKNAKKGVPSTQSDIRIIHRKRHVNPLESTIRCYGKGSDKTNDPAKYANGLGDDEFRHVSNHCYIPQGMTKKYREKRQLKYLVITEGELKAYVGDKFDINIVAIPGITIWKNEKEENTIFYNIHRIIEECKPERLIFLADADCKDINWTETKDLFTRPNHFVSAVSIFKNLCEYYQIDLYFYHINPELNLKGMDDVLLSARFSAKNISSDFEIYNRALAQDNGGSIEQVFFKVQIKTINAIYTYFNLNDQDSFYKANEEHLDTRPFIFKRYQYQFDLEQQKLIKRKSSDFSAYVYIGNNMFKRGSKPMGDTLAENVLMKVDRTRLQDSFGGSRETLRDCINSMDKFDGSVNMPAHKNFKEYKITLDEYGNKSKWYNQYIRVKHISKPGPIYLKSLSEDPKKLDFLSDMPNSVKFIKHIFGNDPIIYNKRTAFWKTHPSGMREQDFKFENVTINSSDLGWDYLQLLWLHPTHILPILVLGSELRHTGKTTFWDWMRMIFQQNVRKIHSSELGGQFTTYFSTSLLMVIEEALIDKKGIFERIKEYSTAKQGKKEGKGTDSEEIQQYLKIGMTTNNMMDALPLDRHETRVWLREIPLVPNDMMNYNLLEDLTKEIPYLLHYLEHRTLTTNNQSRAHFADHLLKTKALTVLKHNSRMGGEVLLEDALKDHFKKCELSVLHFSAKDLVDLVSDLSMKLDYVKRIVQKNWRMQISKQVHFYDLYTFGKQKGLNDHESNYLDQQRQAVHPRPKTRTYQFFASQFFSVPELISFLDADNLVELEKKQKKADYHKSSWFKSFAYNDFSEAMRNEEPLENSFAQKMFDMLKMLTTLKKPADTILQDLISYSESFEQFNTKFQALYGASLKAVQIMEMA